MSLIMDVLNRDKKVQPDPPSQAKKKTSNVVVEAEPKVESIAAAATIPGIDIGQTQIIEQKILTQRIISSSSGESSQFSWISGLVIFLVLGVLAFSVMHFWKTASWKINLDQTQPISKSVTTTMPSPMTPWELTAQVVGKKDRLFSSKGLKLEGIVLDDQKPIALINGQILSVPLRRNGTVSSLSSLALGP